MKKNNQNIYFFIALIFLVLIIITIFSCIYIIILFESKKEAISQSNLIDEYSKQIVNNITKNENSTENTSANEISQNKTKKQILKKNETERMLALKEMQKENLDIIGWLEIPNTSINYPVLQGKDNEFYMTHNYKKEKSKNGSIFLTKDYDWSIPSSNYLIYGHNLGNGTMFQELLKYENKEFYNNHPIIRFTTLTDDSEYEIISVIKTRVFYKSEQNVFRYYFFVNAKTQEEYDNFIKNAKAEALYEIEASATYNEQLLTLSTCSYHVKDGRFAVIARKINKPRE